jgi:uncharacterized protein YqeY
MSLKEKIGVDLNASMKASEKLRTETLRSLRAGILEFEKSEEMKLLLSAAKKRKEAIELYDANARPELAEKERGELAIIQSYLPQQMTEADVAKRVGEVIVEVGASGPQDTNKVIPVLMKELKGKADGKLVQQIVKDQLAALGA